LKVIPEPEPGTATVFKGATNPLGTGNGDLTMICGKCKMPLMENMNDGQVRGVVLYCANCGSYNYAS
jgi:uncharacterized Zn finger protein (UPF0148 family)